MKKVLSVILLVLGVQAGVIEETKSKPVLAAAVTMAPFSVISAKVATLGTMINNPFVPTLLLGTLQQQIKSSHGAFRADAPLTWLVYVQTPAWDVASTNDDLVASEDLCEVVLVYPSVNKVAKTLLHNPGSEKMTDGTLHLLAGENRPEDTFVRFAKDERFCSFAATPALATQSLVDFERLGLAQAKESWPLVKMDILPRGLSALASYTPSELEPEADEKGWMRVWDLVLKMQKIQQQRQTEFLSASEGLTLTLDLDDKGLAVAGQLKMRSGQKPSPAAGFRLPAGACDFAPKGSPFFFAYNNLLQTGCHSEQEFRTDLEQLKKIHHEFFVALAAEKEMAPYQEMLSGVEAITAAELAAARFPVREDWTLGAFAFDQKGHPVIEAIQNTVTATAQVVRAKKTFVQLGEVCARQWPQQTILSSSPDGTFVLDWGAVLDVAAMASGVKPEEAGAKELLQARQKIAAVFGSTTNLMTITQEGATRLRARFSAPKNQPVASGATCEEQLAIALPEIVQDRPAAVFYMMPYALMREHVLPILSKLSKKKDRAQYEAMIGGMTPANPNSAFASALWSDADGSYRFLGRLTANELKNFGAAFNAFTAATMSSALSE